MACRRSLRYATPMRPRSPVIAPRRDGCWPAPSFAGCGGGSSSTTARPSHRRSTSRTSPPRRAARCGSCWQAAPGGPCWRRPSPSSRPGRTASASGCSTARGSRYRDLRRWSTWRRWVAGRRSGRIKARYESLAVKPQFQSQTPSHDPDSAKAVYVAEVPLPAGRGDRRASPGSTGGWSPPPPRRAATVGGGGPGAARRR